MHVECIRFDEVFDAPARTGAFSFRSGGRATYGITLPGRAIPRAGTALAVAFARPGDWAGVLGVRDLATGRVLLRAPAWLVTLDTLCDAWLLGPALLALGLAAGGLAGAAIALALLTGAAGWLLVRAVRANRQIRAALGAAGSEPPPGLPA
jgi:hypothetical protein